MLERSRGARLYRTKCLIEKRIEYAVRRDMHWEKFNSRQRPRTPTKKHFKLTFEDIGMTRKEFFLENSYMLVNEGKNTRYDKGCYDCGPGGCDWCSSKSRLQQKISTRLAKSELKEFEGNTTMNHPNRVYGPYKK